MEQMMYRLNLPQLSECILDNVPEKYLSSNIEYTISTPEEIFKPECLKLKNLKWTDVLIFLKTNGKPGPTHSDNIHPGSITTWGINWYDEYSMMEYWDLKDFDEGDMKYISDRYNYATIHYFPKTSPRIRYILKPGAYLINTSPPHRGIGIRKRYCVSLRSTETPVRWHEVVNLFDDLIDRSVSLTM